MRKEFYQRIHPETWSCAVRGNQSAGHTCVRLCFYRLLGRGVTFRKRLIFTVTDVNAAGALSPVVTEMHLEDRLDRGVAKAWSPYLSYADLINFFVLFLRDCLLFFKLLNHVPDVV